MSKTKQRRKKYARILAQNERDTAAIQNGRLQLPSTNSKGSVKRHGKGELRAKRNALYDREYEPFYSPSQGGWTKGGPTWVLK